MGFGDMAAGEHILIIPFAAQLWSRVTGSIMQSITFN